MSLLKKFAFFAGLFILFSNSARALPEQNLSADFETKILPFMKEHAKFDSFTGANGIKVSYIYLPIENPKGVIVISPGQGDPALKYSELIYDLRTQYFENYDIFVIDHRGQGFSQRLLRNPEKCYVRHFSDYVDDLSTFIFAVVKPEKYQTSLLLGDSMGGGIAGGFLLKHPTTFKNVALFSPMFEINTGPYVSETLAEVLTKILDIFPGVATQYAPGESDYDPNAKVENDTATSSPERFSMFKRLLDLYPNLRTGGVTMRWLNEALHFTRALREQKKLFQVPTLIFQAGRDEWVRPEAQVSLCASSKPFCSIKKIEGAKHDILIEKDIYRDEALSFLKLSLKDADPGL